MTKILSALVLPSPILYGQSQSVSAAASTTQDDTTNVRQPGRRDNNKVRKSCTDIESCREIGEQKVQKDIEDNPVTRLPNGVRYKKLKPGVGSRTVQSNDVVDIIYSISRANGAYMYSRGFGYNKVDGIGGGGGGISSNSDEGIDSYRVQLGRKDLPIGVESALIGSKKGERRRIELPPDVGFETSDWKPEPTTRRGKAQINDYQSILKGRGSSQPPFPAVLIFDVEVLSFRSTGGSTT